MTDKSPFVVPLSHREEANAAKQSLATAASDHLTVYRAYLGYVVFVKGVDVASDHITVCMAYLGYVVFVKGVHVVSDHLTVYRAYLGYVVFVKRGGCGF